MMKLMVLILLLCQWNGIVIKSFYKFGEKERKAEVPRKEEGKMVESLNKPELENVIIVQYYQSFSYWDHSRKNRENEAFTVSRCAQNNCCSCYRRSVIR